MKLVQESQQLYLLLMASFISVLRYG